MGFEHVVAETVILGNIRKEIVWEIIKNFKRYPNIMENVDGVEIHFQGDTTGKSEWFVSVEGAPLRWVEKDFFDKASYTIHFESIDGDFDNINGKWKIEDYEGKGVKVHFSIEYNLGIPVIEEVLGPVLKDKMKANADMMVSGIKNELEHAGTEDRKHERFFINSFKNLEINNNLIRAFIVDVSRGGMKFFYNGKLDAQVINLHLLNLDIKADVFFTDSNRQHVRLVFKNKLNKQELPMLLSSLKSGPVRKNSRILIDKRVKIGIDDSFLNIHLVDISRQGLCFNYNGERKPVGKSITLLDKELAVKDKFTFNDSKQVRVLLADELGDGDLQDIIHNLNFI